MGGVNITIDRFIELLFPIKCIFCGTILYCNTNKEKTYICNTCINGVHFTKEKIIPVCENSYCDGLISVFQYNGLVEKAIKSFKFKNRPELFRAFGYILANRIVKVTNNEEFDIIIYVPLHKIKQVTRGYNQSQLLSEFIAKYLRVPLGRKILVKEKNTLPQSTLSRKLRLINVEGAYKLDGIGKIKGKRVLLVDDVLSTGATLNQCGKLLRVAGAKKITCVVLATNRKIGA